MEDKLGRVIVEKGILKFSEKIISARAMHQRMVLLRTISSPSTKIVLLSDLSITALKHSCTKRFVGWRKDVIEGM